MYFYYFRIADLVFEIRSPKVLVIPSCMQPFRIESADRADLVWEVTIGSPPIYDREAPVSRGEYIVVKGRDCFIRKSTMTVAGERVPFFLCPDRKEGIYRLWVSEEYMRGEEPLFAKLPIWNFLGVEEGLLANCGFILHSSIVSWRGNGLIFTAPSGTGKSTQAGLWNEYEGANIYNGDRTIIRKIGQTYYGFGSPYAGSSGIYRNESAPIRGIIVLSKAKENTVRRLQGKEAFLPLFRETLMNTWNPAYMEHMTDLLLEAAEDIPIYSLACRPDREAVDLVKNTVFKEEANE